ncbi:MAG TPA: efflux RND transporter periplasmic adaptor subunit [Urbifossiella sp.]|jgi:multidrug efflux system membrane fusion protein
MKPRFLLGSFTLAGMMFALALGCQRGPAPAPAAAPPVVPVSLPVQRQVTEFVEYTGRTDAVESVGIRARVTGYLVKAPFKEGSEVKKNDLLFEIDPRPYKAQLDQAKSQVAVNEATLKFSQATYERAKATFDKGAGSKQDVDQAKAAVDESAARVDAAKFSVKLYQINLDFTEIRSPISGQISRYYYTKGNLINQDQTLLTTVVTVDPMYAYFDVDERTVLRVRTAINQGKIKARADGEDLPVLMGLEGEDGYPHQGSIDFVNNVVNPSTGTIAVRGVFKNEKPPNGRRLLSPGMFVRIRLPIGPPHPALLVVDRALGSDQGLKYLYVVNADNKLEYRRVKTGALEDDGLRVIEEGVKANDRVVVGALPQLRPQMLVDPEATAMPTPGAPTAPGQPNGEEPGSTPGKK